MRINDYRNEIEHHFSTKTRDSVSKLISNCFIVIRDFIADHLDRDAKDILGHDAWASFVEVAEGHEREKSGCLRTMDSVDWESSTVEEALADYDCPNCGSDLIRINNPKPARADNQFVCKSCNQQWDYESIAAEALESLGAAYHSSAMNAGGEFEIVQCPTCNNEAYIFSEQHCGVCGETAKHICDSCGREILSSELYLGGRCGYCEHMMNKDASRRR